jgi:hypothetical protein
MTYGPLLVRPEFSPEPPYILEPRRLPLSYGDGDY